MRPTTEESSGCSELKRGARFRKATGFGAFLERLMVRSLGNKALMAKPGLVGAVDHFERVHTDSINKEGGLQAPFLASREFSTEG